MTPSRIREAFQFQSESCASLGSLFMGQLMRLCATKDWPDGAIKTRIFNWQGDLGPRAQSVPLRLAGALHALRLNGHDSLTRVYPPHVTDDNSLWSVVCDALRQEATFIGTWIDSAPQTNEVRRSAPLIALGHWLAGRYDMPLRTSELGASGGLNLHWDRYALEIGDHSFGAGDPAMTLRPEWRGPLPPQTAPNVVARAGVDLNPLDPSDPADALRLQAYLWPDQPERLALTRAAIAAAMTQIDQGDAIDWLAGRLTHTPNTVHLIYSTIAWQYFPVEKQKIGAGMIDAAGAKATMAHPMAWFSMENDGGTNGAALTVRLWPGNHTVKLGRADFHGRWVDWNG
ncbi:DUF2332 domain-containing protein [Yoonia sediminilitoris]|uniref:DUF2332 family protein n=1 Tax=Yoonia sediminilitoris TaxID=1286148 RepID=A0A2T6KB64_9RHOB|nr:DUF2332 family protein [Yoonia sediminilitoris]PUB12063.1 hypothetical protein C8N45_11140 [Yoonia sediminilitoris]RCW92890.1 hypothetical protein DFP92_11139 [Yoonia sediminilitoris]